MPAISRGLAGHIYISMYTYTCIYSLLVSLLIVHELINSLDCSSLVIIYLLISIIIMLVFVATSNAYFGPFNSLTSLLGFIEVCYFWKIVHSNVY